jgi:hypothetical protein
MNLDLKPRRILIAALQGVIVGAGMAGIMVLIGSHPLLFGALSGVGTMVMLLISPRE